MNRFSLQFQNKAMEAEYVQLKRLTIAESVRIMLFFLGLVQLTTGVPALIDRNYTAFGASIALIVSFLMISFLGKGLRNYRQLMAFLVQAIFQFSRPYYVPEEIHNSAINGIFRGFAFASIQLSIISRFPSWNQKALGVVLSFIIKFLLTGFVDNTIFDPSTVLRNVLNSLFVLYVFYSNEKTERLLFKGYYEHREKLAKFKELVENYLPQSIIILNPSKKKCFFANQAFLQTFKEYESLQENTKILDCQENTHADFQNLTVDTDSLTQLGPEEGLVTKFPENSSVLQQFLEEYAENYSVNYKALSFSASGVIEGSRRLFGVTATKLKWDGENALGVVLRDITYQESLLALKVANENKDNILATVSHELRTPLNGIIGILGITQKKIKNTEVLEHLDLCKDNAQLLLGLVNSLLDLQQIKKGSLKLNITKVHIQKVLKDIQRLFQFQCDQKTIFLSLHIDPNIPTHINTDENRLKQILINLVGNALKFTSQGGISLEVTHDRRSSEHLVISVRDTGIGIKETDIGKLFKMYGKLKDGESVNKNGVGLGLMISNALAELLGQNGYGGGIEVDSKFGQGTQFSFRLAKDLDKSQERRKDNETSIIEGKKGFETESSFDKELLNSEYEDQLLAANRSRMSNYTFTKSMAVPDRGPHLMLERDANEEELKLDESIHIGPTKGEILVVDDNPFNLLIAGNLIKQIGYSFNSAKSGSEAIEIIKTRLQSLQPFKAILMDCLMPIMDGYETTRVLTTLMEQKQVPQVPIIALTANKEEEDMKKCLECGMTDYLTKPLLIENLEKMLGKFAD